LEEKGQTTHGRDAKRREKRGEIRYQVPASGYFSIDGKKEERRFTFEKQGAKIGKLRNSKLKLVKLLIGQTSLYADEDAQEGLITQGSERNFVGERVNNWSSLRNWTSAKEVGLRILSIMGSKRVLEG